MEVGGGALWVLCGAAAGVSRAGSRRRRHAVGGAGAAASGIAEGQDGNAAALNTPTMTRTMLATLLLCHCGPGQAVGPASMACAAPRCTACKQCGPLPGSDYSFH